MSEVEIKAALALLNQVNTVGCTDADSGRIVQARIKLNNALAQIEGGGHGGSAEFIGGQTAVIQGRGIGGDENQQGPVIATLHRRDGEADNRFDTIIRRRDLCYEGIMLYAAQPAPKETPRDFPTRIMALLRNAADRNGTETRGPWEDENGEPLQDDAEAAIRWIQQHAGAQTQE